MDITYNVARFVCSGFYGSVHPEKNNILVPIDPITERLLLTAGVPGPNKNDEKIISLPKRVLRHQPSYNT